MNDSIITAIDAVQQLAAYSERQDRDIRILAEGTGRQANIIRRLQDELSRAAARATSAEYLVELVKRQGRKTRAKVKGLREQIDGLRDQLMRHSATVREQATKIAELRGYLNNALHARELPAPLMFVKDAPHQVTVSRTSEGHLWQRKTICLRQAELSCWVNDESLLAQDEHVFRMVAKEMTRRLTVSTEQEIFAALMAEARGRG